MAQTQQLTSNPSAFQDALLAWYRQHARPLPWRDQPTLYKTVVSEFMLQQTQVKTVLPYFARWLEVLPDFKPLARAPETQVLKLWEGLGYYSRARNLHKLAQALVAMPKEPRTPEAWRELPGIGPYTAAAITSITFNAPAAVVDGNVVRILARLAADDTPHKDGTSAVKAFTSLADALINPAEPGDHNQAMMELGATVCLRRNPLCTVCPVRGFCAGCRAGDPESYPRLAAKQMEKVTVIRGWCLHRGKLLLHRISQQSRRLANQHELPCAEQLEIDATQLKADTLLATKKRGITRYQITELIHTITPPKSLQSDLVWVPVEDLDSITLSGPHRRWVRELLTETQ